jgi:hypothetical protein
MDGMGNAGQRFLIIHWGMDKYEVLKSPGRDNRVMICMPGYYFLQHRKVISWRVQHKQWLLIC